MNFTKFVRFRLLCIVLVNVLWISAEKANPVCKNPECVELADILKKNMQESVSPCTDFYTHVCGRWLTQNPRPKYENSWDLERVMELRALKNLKTLLESKEVSNIPEFEDAKALHRACTNLPFMDKSDSKTMKNLVKLIGDWPMLFPKGQQLQHDIPWTLVENKYITRGGESAFFDYSVVREMKKTNKIVITILQPYSPYGMLYRHRRWHSNGDEQNYKHYLYTVLEAVTPDHIKIAKTVAHKDIDDVMSFRNTLWDILVQSEKDETYEVWPLSKITQWYNDQAKAQNTAQIDWVLMVKSMYKNGKDAYGKIVTDDTMVILQTNYVTRLIKLLLNTPKRVLVNHSHLFFMERHLKLTPDLEALLKKTYSEEIWHDAKIRYPKDRWLICAQRNNMVTSTAKLYLSRFFKREARDDVVQIFEESKQLLKKQIMNSNWMNAETKNKSLVKIDAIKSQIGFPDWFLPAELSNRRELEDGDPLNADAYYVAKNNKLYVTAAYLQWPIHGLNWPYVMRYAGTASMFGHELHHAFGVNGIMFNEHGLLKQWWSPVMYAKLKSQEKCFADQYNGFKEDKMKKLKIPITRDYSSTTNEDIADVMGLKLAYMGYRDKLKSRNGICEILPGFKNCEQLFFIMYANAFCADLTPLERKRYILEDNHSLQEIRVNGAVTNMKSFNEAFNCHGKVPLKPKKTCDLWIECKTPTECPT